MDAYFPSQPHKDNQDLTVGEAADADGIEVDAVLDALRELVGGKPGGSLSGV